MFYVCTCMYVRMYMCTYECNSLEIVREFSAVLSIGGGRPTVTVIDMVVVIASGRSGGPGGGRGLSLGEVVALVRESAQSVGGRVVSGLSRGERGCVGGEVSGGIPRLGSEREGERGGVSGQGKQ